MANNALNGSKQLKILQNGPNCLKMAQNAKIAQNDSNWLKMLKMPQIGSLLVKMTQNA